MLNPRNILATLSLRHCLRQKRLLIWGHSPEAAELAAVARCAYAMQVEEKADNQIAALQAGQFDMVFVADPGIAIDNGFMNSLAPSTWIVVGTNCLHRLDQTAAMHALWFDTIGGFVLPGRNNLSRDLVQSENVIAVGGSVPSILPAALHRPTIH